MYEEIYDSPPNQTRVKLKSRQRYSTGMQWRLLEKKYSVFTDGFQCRHCQAYVYLQPAVSGVQNRNHCPYCLWSRHVDYHQPGDRMSACKSIMQPLGLTLKRRQDKYAGARAYGELMLIHRCNECGKLSINRIAADDQVERLMELYQESLALDGETRNQLEAAGIHLLLEDDVRVVINQLWGYNRL